MSQKTSYRYCAITAYTVVGQVQVYQCGKLYLGYRVCEVERADWSYIRVRKVQARERLEQMRLQFLEYFHAPRRDGGATELQAFYGRFAVPHSSPKQGRRVSSVCHPTLVGHCDCVIQADAEVF